MFISVRLCAAGFAAMLVFALCAESVFAQVIQDRDPSHCRSPAEMKEIAAEIDRLAKAEKRDTDKLARLERVRETDNDHYQTLKQQLAPHASDDDKAKIEKASEVVKIDDLKIQDVRINLGFIKKELPFLRSLKPCPPPSSQVTPVPPTEFPFGPNGPYETASFEFSGYGGSVAASSFGSDFNPNVWGGRAVARVPVGQFRLQADIQGERTSDYSSIAGNRSYFAGGAHADWMWATNTEIGAFGGFQNAKPTFFGPTSTNYFVGLEGRKFFGPAMVGVQFGRFDVTNGPGTLTDAWFVEGRAKFSLGEAFRIPALKYTIIGGNLGYGSGTASAVSTRAQTTYWGLGLTQGIANTPISLSLTYDHFENRVDGLGLVWKENKLMGGVKILLPSTDIARGRIEPTVPLPYILGTVMTF